MSLKPTPPHQPVLLACETPGCTTRPEKIAALFLRDGKKVCAPCNAKAHDAERAKIHAPVAQTAPSAEPAAV